MNQLNIVNKNGSLLADSREIAEMTGKRHDNLVRDIKMYSDVLTTSDLRALDFFIESSYQDVKGESRLHYLLTKNGCDMVANKMTGEKGILFTATYVTRFSEMEQQLLLPQVPTTLTGALRLAADIEDKRLLLEQKIEEDRPKTLFAEAVATSQDCILIGQLATMLKQNGVNIGQTRLFNYLREEGYLCKSGDRRNLPTQRSMDLKLFEVKEFTVHGNTGIRVKTTPKVTGRGQVYFFNKFLSTAS